MNKPRVINIDLEPAPEGAVYIGRPTKWANPFKVGKDGDIATVRNKYIAYMKNNHQLIADARVELKGKNLLCHCKPAQCHGDLLLLLAGSFEDINIILERLKNE